MRNKFAKAQNFYKIKEGDLAYWKHTTSFGIVTQVTFYNQENHRNYPIGVYVSWEDHNVFYPMEYTIEDLTGDNAELVVGKAVKLLYEKA